MIVGILALQGAFREHEEMLTRMGVPCLQVRLPRDLAKVDRLIMPGGESTTIGKLLVMYDLIEPIRQRVLAGMPIWGTCAGAILLSRKIIDGKADQILMPFTPGERVVNLWNDLAAGVIAVGIDRADRANAARRRLGARTGMVGSRHALAAFDQRPNFTAAIDNGL